jgi:DNA-binding XRE family transcriptional regulator
MLEHTKKLPAELKFLGSQANKTKAIKALKSLGFVNISDTVPWRDLFPEYADEELPGVCLARSRHKENMTQKQLSELTGIPQSHISEMENDKRGIGKKAAKILAKVLNVNYRVFL